MPGDVEIRLLRDSVKDDDQDHFSPKYLNSLKYPNFPAYKLKLKVGAPIILLYNLSTAIGLYNRIRMRIRAIRTRTLEYVILTRPFTSNVEIILRIPIDLPSQGANAIAFKRDQFLVRLAWGMTINKA